MGPEVRGHAPVRLASRLVGEMAESHAGWEAELGGGAVGCWDGAGAEQSGVGGACVKERRPVSLRAPPLFRSISPTGVSAGLPPHRRLRAVFRRSRAVLPADTPRVCGDALSQADGFVGTPARTRDLARAASPTLELPRRAAVPANAPMCPPAALNRQGGGRPCPQPAPSPRTRRDRKGSWGGVGVGVGAGAVSPAAQGEGPTGGAARADERKRKKRRRRTEGRRVNYPGNEWRGVPAHNAEGGGDRALCSWLESLGLTDTERDTPGLTASANRQGRTLQEAGSLKGRADPGQRGAEPSRRDRRPYFLPPISQSGALLYVPLLLPENSPPPSPCSSPTAPVFPLPVPRLQPLPPTRK
ncbi:histone-lysine N-methyltransferase 2B-like [Anguilla anguilla]|uniref:histone-lysine N-methyltransferase 2B-like n=1 Tax=Anguilla anguilla TaxID=7936 RepID=UPI0015AE9341|nr:histone-lysine N-methyltransferase 2B-like [Anguilla anguilla]XP_035253339.1 histone-lysine N-methyltransferase 2B-like [Anguilla anguilla]